jgi:hypothetical protein
MVQPNLRIYVYLRYFFFQFFEAQMHRIWVIMVIITLSSLVHVQL